MEETAIIREINQKTKITECRIHIGSEWLLVLNETNELNCMEEFRKTK